MFSQPPSRWVFPDPSNLSDSERALALDFDAACMAIGLDAEKQLRDQILRNRGLSVTRKLGVG